MQQNEDQPLTDPIVPPPAQPPAVMAHQPPCQPPPPLVLAPPLHYQFYNPMMFPHQPPPMGMGPHFYQQAAAMHQPPPMGMAPQFYQQPAAPYPAAPFSPGSSPPNHFYPEHERDWSTGLFQCTSDIKNCFSTMICPCLTFGEMAEILTEGHTPWYEPGALCACLGAASFVFLFLLWLSFPYTCSYRVKMRKKYKLKGSLIEDCCINAFCGWCALCQQYRELDHQGFNVSLGWHENKRRERQAVAIFRLIPPEEQGMSR